MNSLVSSVDASVSMHVKCPSAFWLTYVYVSREIVKIQGFSVYEKGGPLPKFGEWDVNDPASAEGFTVIFNKARNEKKTGGKPDSPVKDDSQFKHGAVLGKPQSFKFYEVVEYLKKMFCLYARIAPIKNGFAACKLPVQNHRKLFSFKSFARKASYIYVQPRCKIRKTGAYQKL
ncbi:hypothetical protein WN944_011144 [Citrus x changshan-huyou]|uniref:RIN4 pathogenic type III effector avirulence factor Avr cleavage site domain-containing protein n=1 Tax=Citrus x changshan-huyou TaxID=2935761 RepID=A0AAP0MXR1_9ROSI